MLLIIGILAVTIGLVLGLQTSSVSTRQVKMNDSYRVGNNERKVPNIQLKNKFYHLKDNVRNDMYNLFKAVVQLLDNNGIEYYLQCGTLLGQVRHGGFIPWDDDIDIGVPLTFKDKLLSVTSGNSEFEITKYKELWKLHRHDRRFPFVDILLEEQRDGKLCHCLPFNKSEHCTFGVHKQLKHEAFPVDWVYPLKKVQLKILQ